MNDCDKDDEITRDYLEGIEAQDDKNRESLKNIWMEAICMVQVSLLGAIMKTMKYR